MVMSCRWLADGIMKQEVKEAYDLLVNAVLAFSL